MADLEARHFLVRRDQRGVYLVPSDFLAEEFLDQFKTGDELSLQARKSRVSKNHKHFFGVLRVAREHLEAYQDDESLLDAAKIAVGHTRPVKIAMAQDSAVTRLVKRIRGLLGMVNNAAVKDVMAEAVSVLDAEERIVWLPKSINWDVMDEDDFRRFKNRVFYVLTQLLETDVVALAEAEWEAKRQSRMGDNWR